MDRNKPSFVWNYFARSVSSAISLDADPLVWWKLHQDDFPSLSKLALKYLCIHATSVSSEMIFSVSGLVVNRLRARLSPERVDMLIFLRETFITVIVTKTKRLIARATMNMNMIIGSRVVYTDGVRTARCNARLRPNVMFVSFFV